MSGFPLKLIYDSYNEFIFAHLLNYLGKRTLVAGNSVRIWTRFLI